MNVFERACEYNRAHLSEARQRHILSVTREAEELSSRLGITGDADDFRSSAGGLRLAALLHDCTKEETLKYNLKLCEECGIMLTNDDIACPNVIHGKSAAGVAARDFGLAKPFCDAIFYHTTGCAGMSLIEKIIFIADYIEPQRNYGDCREARRMFYENAGSDIEENLKILDRTVLFSLERTILSLKARQISAIHPDSLAAYASISGIPQFDIESELQ